MPKREIVSKDTINILEHIADLIKDEVYTTNKLVDFKPGDVVRSSILLGLHRVELIGDNAVLVSSITGSGPIYPIHPKYLKIVKINEKTVDILYNAKDGRD